MHKSVLTASSVMALTLFGDSLLYSVLPLYYGELGLPLVSVGVILSINRWVRLVFNPLAAVSFEKYGLFLPLLAATIAGNLSTLAYGASASLTVFLLARSAWGLAWSHLRLGTYLLILSKARDSLGLTMGAMNSVARLGSAFTVLVGSALIDVLGYKSGMLIIALLSFLAIPVALSLRSHVSAVGTKTTGAVSEVGPSRRLQPLGDRTWKSFKPTTYDIAGFINNLVGQGIAIASISLVLKARLGTEVGVGGLTVGIATVSGMILAVRWISTLVVSPLAGYLSDLYERRHIFLGLLVVQSGAMLSLGVFRNPVVTIGTACLVFFATNSIEVVLNAAVAESTDDKSASWRMSVYASYVDLGLACGPLVGYALGAALGFDTVYVMGAAAIAVVILGEAAHPRMKVSKPMS